MEDGKNDCASIGEVTLQWVRANENSTHRSGSSDSAYVRKLAPMDGARGGNRTHTALRPPDFESGASASSATRAFCCNSILMNYLLQPCAFDVRCSQDSSVGSGVGWSLCMCNQSLEGGGPGYCVSPSSFSFCSALSLIALRLCSLSVVSEDKSSSAFLAFWRARSFWPLAR